MRLFNFRIPETEHLPVPQREEILKRCLASNEMRRYKSIANPICALLATVTVFGFLFLSLEHWKWNQLGIILAVFPVWFISFVILLVIKFSIEIQILRRLAKNEARK
jgi:hypothetical protein